MSRKSFGAPEIIILITGALTLLLPGLNKITGLGIPHRDLWCLVIAINLMAAIIIRLRQSYSPLPLIRSAYLVSFIISCCLVVLPEVKGKSAGWDVGWNVLYVHPDSHGYVGPYKSDSLRPPAYTFFIWLVTVGTKFDYSLADYPENTPIRDTSKPLFRVVRAQMVFLILSLTLVCISLMYIIDIPLPPILFIWLYDRNYLGDYNSSILSEPLAQIWLLLLLAVLFTFARTKHKLLIPVAGAVCALFYLTRSAGAYGGIILAVMIAWALWSNWRAYWRSAVAGVAVAAFLVALPIFHTYFSTSYLSPAPMYSWAKIPFALQVAQPADISIMPDEESKKFLSRALEMKKGTDEKVRAQYAGQPSYGWYYLPANLYLVAYPTANEFPGFSPTDVNRLFMKVSSTILETRRLDYYRLGWESFVFAIDTGTRLNKPPFKFSVLLIFSLISIIILRGWIGICGAALILSHLAHLVIVALNDAPISRYIYATEFLVLTAVTLLAWGIIDKILTSGIEYFQSHYEVAIEKKRGL